MTSRKINWGIISTANIGVNKVIPAMQKCANLQIMGLASRDGESAKEVASKLDIPKSYDSYEAILDDPDIDAIYNPLPNHLHFHWTKKAIEKGKHVLCEKPMTLNSEEINELISLRNKHMVKVGEAFMVRTHPQWIEALKLIKKGELGKTLTIQSFFSYYKTDRNNIRNIPEYGGGAIWDIGCYPVHLSRYLFMEEPRRVLSLIDRDPELKIDRLATVVMDFDSGQSTFTVSTQRVPHQRTTIFGDKNKLEVIIPFNAPNDRESTISLDDGDLFMRNKKTISFKACDQYTLQGEKFSEAILKNSEVPVPLEDSLKNTITIEAIFKSEETGTWVHL